MAEPSTSITFHKPFAEQLAAFRLRMGDLVPTARWDDLKKDQHNRSFMVAGATKAELLADLAGAIDKAISKGTTFDTFQKDFRAIVEKHGWHGWTGEGTAKGEAWRMRVIYQTNLRTSYMAGRHAQLVEAGFKYWVYRHGGSAEPRLHHLALDGLILSPDHPFWQTHYPPNGWGCRCRVFGSHSKRGAKVQGGDPDKTLPDGWDSTVPKTGEPPGIDKGWGYAPGGHVVNVVNALAPKLEELPERIGKDLLRSWLEGSGDATPFATWLAAPAKDFPLVVLGSAQAKAIGAETRVAYMSAGTAGKQVSRHPDLLAADYISAQEAVDAATHTIVETDPETGIASLIFVFDDRVRGLVIVVKSTKTGKRLFVTSLRRVSTDDARRDAEIQRLLAKSDNRL